MSNEVPRPIRIQLLQQELQGWINTRFVWQSRHRARKHTDNKGAIKEAEAALEECEIQIAEFESMLKEVEAEV